MLRNDLKFGSRRYAPKLKPKTGWPELTALIDVLFIMLLFFALSGSFVRISGIRVDLPRYTAPNKADVERLVVTVSPPEVPGKPCQVYFQDKLVTMDMLKQEFLKLNDSSKRTSIVVYADRSVPFDTVSQVMALAGSAGISGFIALGTPDVKRETRFEQR